MDQLNGSAGPNKSMEFKKILSYAHETGSDYQRKFVKILAHTSVHNNAKICIHIFLPIVKLHSNLQTQLNFSWFE